MASSQQSTTIQNLPGKLLSEILIRIPAKPLAQMRSVSKTWNHLLSQPSFIKFHLIHRSIQAYDEILLVLTDGAFDQPSSVTAHLSSLSPHLELTNFIKLPVTCRSESETIEFIGSVNGLICFCFQSSNSHLVIQIWNPSLSTILTLPPCQLPNRNFDCFRFGYDPKTDDYKLVKHIWRLQEWLQVEVYSLRKDSWGLVTQKFPSHVIDIFNEDPGCVDGSDGRLHWLGSVGVGRKVQTIVAFDLGIETFSEIPLPGSVIDHDDEHCWDSIGILAGKLCVMSCNKNLECEIWVMDEYGVAESWVKHNVLSELSGVFCPYGFTLSNKFLFATFDERFCLYDPISTNTETVAIISRMKVVRYVESLVWIEPVRTGCSKVHCKLKM